MAKVDLRKLGVVFRREYLERVCSKWFLIGTLLGPVFLGVIRVLPAYISMKQGPGNALTNVVVLDTTGTGLGARVGSALAKSFPAVPSPRVKLVTPERLAVAEDSAVNAVNAVIRKDINGLLVLDSNTVANGSVRYAGRNASSISDMQTLMSSVKQMGSRLRGGATGTFAQSVGAVNVPARGARGRGVRRAPAVHDQMGARQCRRAVTDRVGDDRDSARGTPALISPQRSLPLMPFEP